MKKNKLISISISGQMCNQIVYVANMIASGLKNNFSVAIYNFKYYKYFERKHNKDIVYKKSIFRIFEYKVWSCLPLRLSFCVLSDAQSNINFFHNLKNAKNILVKGWPYYDFEALKLYSDQVREYMKPKQYIFKHCKTIIDEYRFPEKVLIAVHIRRKDYAFYKEGEFFYNDSVYLSYCIKMKELLSAKIKEENIYFLIFSDEKIDLSEYKELNQQVFDLSSDMAIYDLYTMSMCDYIIGPPSTFNGWASFYGNTPHYWIKSGNEVDITLEQFRIWLLEEDAYGNRY